MLYEYELGDLVDYLFDDEKKRHNLYSPGHKIKVLNPERIKKMESFYIIIFAWRYSDIIMRKSKRYVKSKDIFVRPLPRFEVVKK